MVVVVVVVVVVMVVMVRNCGMVTSAERRLVIPQWREAVTRVEKSSGQELLFQWTTHLQVMIIMVIGGGVGVGNVDGGVDGGDGDCTEVSDFLDAIVSR